MLAAVTALVPRTAALSRLARDDAPTALIGFSSVLGLSFANGGFFATTWGWWALPLLLLTGTALVVRARPALGPRQAVMLCLLAALVGWTALSAIWASGAGTPLLEAERSILYFAAATAVLLVPGRASARGLAAGLLAACAIVSAWGLAVRLDLRAASAADFEGYRLAGPLGYSNGLGLVAAIGALLALGFVAQHPRLLVRAAAAASLVVFVSTLALTFSRGSWLALAGGLVALLALEPQRRERLPRLLAAAAAPALAAWLSGRSSALTQTGAPAAEVTRQEHRLGLALLGLILLAGVLAYASDRVRAPRVGRKAAWTVGAVVVAAALAAATIGLARAGGPGEAAHRAIAAFRSTDSTAGSSHVFSASGSYRSDYWGVAWREASAHPLFGGGAGSFGRWWLRFRPIDFGGLDAHELYLETLAELGAVGLLLLVGALALPLALLRRRTRAAPLVAACGAAYVAFLVHAALDWDWELPAAGIAGLLCGAALLRAEEASLLLRWPARAAAVAVVLALASFVFVMHVANVSLAASESARDREALGAAARDARRAERWQPWSAQAPLSLGKTQLAAGDVEGAVASFRTAIRRDRDDWEAWYQLALGTTGADRAAALGKARELNPRAPELAALRKP
jgi:hypothetical protein